MGVFTKAVNLTVIFFSAAMALEAAGINMFSGQLFTPFGALFFFIAFLNELGMVYL